MADLDLIKRNVKKLKLDSYVIRLIKTNIEQIRFSNNLVDLRNYWTREGISIFLNSGKKITEISLDNDSNIKEKIEKSYRSMIKGEESNTFNGINPEKYSSIENIEDQEKSVELDDIVNACVEGAREGGSERSTGLAYRTYTDDHIITPFNEHHVTYDDFNFDIRAFRGQNTGQEGVHFSSSAKDPVEIAKKAGMEAGKTASLIVPSIEFEAGNFETLLSPYVIGNIFTYCSSLFSAYSVQMGMSYLDESLGNRVASESLTLSDSPLNKHGSNYTVFDDEGTPCFNKNLITHGVLENFVHSYSTAVTSGTKTTGNAGIISPEPLQLSMESGNRSVEELLHSIDHGLYIKNAWYTRFQDNRNAVFSTVPRDGIFRVENGEIAGRISGVRISDSFGKIIKNISGVSSELKNVKFWEEVSPSIMASVLVQDLHVTKAF